MKVSYRRTLSFTLGITLTLLSSTPLIAEEQPEVPADLRQLLQRWERVPKDPTVAATTWKVASLSFAEGKAPSIAALSRHALEAAEAQGGVLTHLVATKTSDNARQHIIKTLTPQRDADKFCAGFTLREYTAKPGERLSADQLAARKEQHRLSQCSKQIKAIFSGVFHANPPVVMVEMKFRQAEQEHHQFEIYLPSLVNAKQWLNYRVVIR